MYTFFVRKSARQFFPSLFTFTFYGSEKLENRNNWTVFYPFSKSRHSVEKLVKNWEGGSAKNL